MPRMVFCEKEQRETDGLDFVPWPGALGQRVYAHIGKPAWAAWLAHQTMLINEQRLSPLDRKHRAYLDSCSATAPLRRQAMRRRRWTISEPLAARHPGARRDPF